jgi:hypothetical protein
MDAVSPQALDHMQVRPANASAAYPDNDVCSLFNLWVLDLFDGDKLRAGKLFIVLVQDRCLHDRTSGRKQLEPNTRRVDAIVVPIPEIAKNLRNLRFSSIESVVQCSTAEHMVRAKPFRRGTATEFSWLRADT